MSAAKLPATVGRLLDAGARALAEAKVGNARREARLLLAHLLEQPADRLIAKDGSPVGDPVAGRFDSLVARRAGGEPLSRILGAREFWSLRFAIGPGVLDPRPDSETVVAAVLRHLLNQGSSKKWLSLLDLGTGSGCLLIALLRELPAATGVGIDRSRAALEIARRNAASLGTGSRMRFVQGNWNRCDGIPEGPFAVIVSNPPYIPRQDLGTLPDAVRRFDPPEALDGGADGLDAYRAIARHAKARLGDGGTLALEIGHDQAVAVLALLSDAGWRSPSIHKDIAGRDRCILATV